MPRILCIMGSGETAPTMTSVHADLIARMGPSPVPATMLDTPFGFQENADDICARASAYFRDNVGFPITIATFRDREKATPLQYETMLARINEARYVFAGPGSPTYALRQWRDTAVPDALAAKLRNGGCVTFASAAAVGLGALALTVYEVYKVGEPPRWLDGLDLLKHVGLRAAVIPHYNNAEGGTHDTRYCYMGERRLRMLEEALPDDTSILGVDEHTACIFDLDAGTATVRGRGAVTWRHRAASRRFENGMVVPIEALAESGVDMHATPRPVNSVQDASTAVGNDDRPLSESPFLEELAKHSEDADTALRGRDVETAVEALLAIDTQRHEWAADTLDSDEQEQARAALRQYVVRLGELARDGAADPRERLAPVVDRLLTLRQTLRTEGEFQMADRLRMLLVDAGVEVRDTREGSDWELMSAESAGKEQRQHNF
jgi:cyanophycinase-like exopeptidase